MHQYPNLARGKTKTDAYKLLIRFVEYSKRTRFLLQLYGGGSYLKDFVGDFDNHDRYYRAPLPIEPVIIILDNDSGPKHLLKRVEGLASVTIYPKKIKKSNLREADYIHVMHNLYIVLTPLGKAEESAMEDLFDPGTKKIKLRGKSFNLGKDFDKDRYYGKDCFANEVVKAQKGSINFDGFRALLGRVSQAIEH